ncbi:MAG: hypothetical protein ACTSRN_01485 [Alphaproteobacteria bacterium]
MPDTKSAPTLLEETERLRKWREVRRRAAADPTENRQDQAAQDRAVRLDQFEADKSKRIRDAESRRREDAEAIETRRMEKARAHLEALDDIETAKAALLEDRRKSRRITLGLLAVLVGLPTLFTALFYMFFAAPVFQSTSVFALNGALPVSAKNPFFNDVSTAMAPAFQLRAQMQAPEFGADGTFEVAIDTSQGLLTLTTDGETAAKARILNTRILRLAMGIPAPIKVLTQPNGPAKAQAIAPRKTLLTFLISLSLFGIFGIFSQSIRHHVRH